MVCMNHPPVPESDKYTVRYDRISSIYAIDDMYLSE